MIDEIQTQVPDQNPNILLLEDSRTVQNYIRDVLRALPIEHELHTARRIDEAALVAGKCGIDLFIVDIGLPDGDGIDFLCMMAAMHPGARALIITSTPREEYRDRARSLGVLSFLAKPLQRKELLEVVTGLLAKRDARAPERLNATGGFEGTLGGLLPPDIIQLKCLSQATGKVEFSTEDRYGFVWFENGDVVHAVAEHLGGRMSGMEAFEFIVSWRSGTAREVERDGEVARTITKDWQTLLMEASEASQHALTGGER